MDLTADQLAQVQTPTLLVFADDDPMGGAPIGQLVADLMVDAELHVVDGGLEPTTSVTRSSRDRHRSHREPSR